MIDHRPDVSARTTVWAVGMALVIAGCASPSPSESPSGGPEGRPDYRSVEEAPEPEAEASPDAEASGGEEGDGKSGKVDRELRRKAASYQKRLVRRIGEEWTPPALDEARLKRAAARAVVYVRLDEQGHVASYEFRRPSGSEAFDESIERCLEKFRPDGESAVPLPEDQRLREAILRRGFNLRRWHYDQ